MDASRQILTVGIDRADHDPGVPVGDVVKLDEVSPVQRDNRPTESGRECENIRIRNSATRLTRI